MKAPKLVSGEYHILVARQVGPVDTAACYDWNGKQQWRTEALCRGVNGPGYDVQGGDTPPGLYRYGNVIKTQQDEPWSTWQAYGEYFIEMLEMESQESARGRAGVGSHGGGTGLLDALAKYQELLATLGCLRWHNGFLKDVLVPLRLKAIQKKLNTYVTVDQSALAA